MKRIERKQQENLQNEKKKRPYKKIIRMLLIGLIGVILCGLIVLNVLIWSKDVSKLEEAEPRPTFIYDQNGNIASKISNSNIEGVRLDEMPKALIEAVISVEDQQFDKHHGINYFGIVRAFTQNLLKGKSLPVEVRLRSSLQKICF